jgi:Tfp pilus assembly protein PilV
MILPNIALRPRSSLRGTRAIAFTLLEVMIACGIFFMCIFAVLMLVSSSLRNARILRQMDVDAGSVAAQLVKTNRVTEGITSGDLDDVGYPDYSYEADAEEAATNGLWQVDILVRRRGKSDPVDKMSIWVYSPDSKKRP